MAVITKKPNPLPQNCAQLCAGLHISSVGSELTASSPLLIEESSDSSTQSLAPGTLLSSNTVSIKEGASYPYNALNGDILIDIW
jgi:hypothetical protein